MTRDGAFVRFDVHDTGIGVPEHARAHLFDQFTLAGWLCRQDIRRQHPANAPAAPR